MSNAEIKLGTQIFNITVLHINLYLMTYRLNLVI